jgi:MoxR-like ATPase
MTAWRIYQGTGKPHEAIKHLPPPPTWRQFHGEIMDEREPEHDPHIERRFGDLSRGQIFQASDKEIDFVNAALYLRRPLLVTGKPGAGKSSLAYAVAYELKLGRVLRWPITSRSTLQDGLYRYDAIGRLQEANLTKEAPDIGKFVRLGPLGTALLPTRYPRVLLIDEIDKSDIDLPNDLLNVFEEGEFEIPELARLSETQAQVQVLPHDSQERVAITRGRVVCHAFPFVVLTNNSERELPLPFLRRCLRLDIAEPTPEKLAQIVQAHFGTPDTEASRARDNLVATFLKRREHGDLATDQLLNAIYLTMQNVDLEAAGDDKEHLLDAVLKYLGTSETV